MRRLRRALTAVAMGAAFGAVMGTWVDPGDHRPWTRYFVRSIIISIVLMSPVYYWSLTRTAAARGRSVPEEPGVTSERADRLSLISTWHRFTSTNPFLSKQAN